MSIKSNKNSRKKYKVKNWPEYDISLKNRGDITVWMTDEAIKHWTPAPIGKRGGQLKYSELAIETAVKIRLLFGKRLRQTEGFLNSIIKLMQLDLPVPDHTTISRRMADVKTQENKKNKKTRGGPLNILIDSSGLKIYGEGEWNELKHNNKKRRSWRKLHLTIDDKGEIIAKKLTKHTIGDSTCIDDLLEQVDEDINSVFADGGYDGNPTYKKIESKPQDKIPKIIIPPKKHSRIRKDGNFQRNRHIKFLKKYGRAVWEIANNYKRRLLVENAIYRYKTIIGRKLNSRNFDNQKNEASIACNILNKMFQLGKPISKPA